MTKPHLSTSQLELYARCPEAYRRRYVEGERRPPGVAMLVGTGVHSGAEVNFRQKIESHVDLSANEIVDAAVASYNQRVHNEGVQPEIGQSKRLATALGRDHVVHLASAHAAAQAPHYQPVEVEKATTIILPSCSHDLVAVTDLRDDKNRVVDFKTAAKAPTNGEAHASLQLTVVATAYQVDRGEKPNEVRLDVLTKTREPKRYVLASERDEQDFAALANRIESIVGAINAGVFPPTSPANWQCSAKWCGYYRTCKYVNPRRSG